MRVLRKNQRGFTLVELMIVVAIVGVLAALAIYGVRRYIANAKTAEARNGIGQMAKDAAGHFNHDSMAGVVLKFTETADSANQLCDKADDPVPKDAANIKGKKYQSGPSEWQAGTAHKGWMCVKFSMTDPQYYQYDYQATGPTADDGTFTALAHGDLDGDDSLSTFQLQAGVEVENAERVVKIAPNMEEFLSDE